MVGRGGDFQTYFLDQLALVTIGGIMQSDSFDQGFSAASPAPQNWTTMQQPGCITWPVKSFGLHLTVVPVIEYWRDAEPSDCSVRHHRQTSVMKTPICRSESTGFPLQSYNKNLEKIHFFIDWPAIRNGHHFEARQQQAIQTSRPRPAKRKRKKSGWCQKFIVRPPNEIVAVDLCHQLVADRSASKDWPYGCYTRNRKIKRPTFISVALSYLWVGHLQCV
jgi:hypothetical protein